MKQISQGGLSGNFEWARAYFWRRQTLYAVGLVALLIFLIVQLSLIPKGAANIEVEYAQEMNNFSSIADNPLSLPHKLVTFAIREFSNNIRFIRAVSIIFFGLCCVALYRILKRWHSDKIALFSTVLFATNASVLAVGRLGYVYVLLFGWAILVSLLLWLRHGLSRKIAPFALAIIGTFLIYVPGAPYFFALLIVLFANKLTNTITGLKRSSFYISLGIGLVALAPLVYSFIQTPELVRQWLLLPESVNWGDIPRNIWSVPSAFIYKAPANPLFNVGSLPIFDVVSGGLFLVGLYAYQKHIKLERTKIMLLTALLSIILGALGQTLFAILILLPFVYSVIGAGISYLLDEWYGVFPRNPFARSFGLLLVTLTLLISVYYQLTRFLIVWSNAPETRDTYSNSRIVE